MTMVLSMLTVLANGQSSRMQKEMFKVESEQDVARLKAKYPKWNIEIVELTPKDSLAVPNMYYAQKFSTFSFGSEGVLYRVLEEKKKLVKIGDSQGIENTKIRKLGRYKTTKITTGQSGSHHFEFTGERGIRIFNDGRIFQMKEVAFHMRYNTPDSILFRINIYKTKNGLPAESILNKDVLVKAYKNDKWIRADISAQNLIMNQDVILTYEVAEIWWSKHGENQLFFTHGEGYERGGTYFRNSGAKVWSMNSIPIAAYILVEEQQELIIN